MKIGILTFHGVANPGSMLQTYCLQRILEDLVPGARVEVADYVPAALRRKQWRYIITPRWPFFRLREYRKHALIRSFLERHCTLSPERLISDDLYEAQAFIRRQRYDAVVVGSDTVWELRERGVTRSVANVYYEPGDHEIVTTSFAASADPVDSRLKTELIASELGRRALGAIRGFDFISVRDEATAEYLRELGVGPERIKYMPDPTLLWDFSTLVEPLPDWQGGEKPVAGVAIAARNLRRNIAMQLIAAGYDAVNLLGGDGGSLSLPGGLSFGQQLAVYEDLDLLVTDRFHGSIFAFKLGAAPVIFLEDSAKWSDANSKGRDLFARLGVEEMVMRISSGVPKDLVERGIATWQRLEPDIGGAIARLRQHAEGDTLRELRSVLENSKSGWSADSHVGRTPHR